MENVFSFFLGQIGKAFDVMQNFEVWQGLSLFDLFIVLIVLNVVITLFVPLLGKQKGGKADTAQKADKGKKNG